MSHFTWERAVGRTFYHRSFFVIVLSHTIRRWLSLSLFQTDAWQPRILSLPFSLLLRFNLSSRTRASHMISEDYLEGKTNFAEETMWRLLSFDVIPTNMIFNLCMWKKMYASWRLLCEFRCLFKSTIHQGNLL